MEHIQKMKPLLFAALFVVVLPLQLGRASASSAAQKSQPSHAEIPRVTIEVYGGESDVPVENASVYIKYIQEHRITKDKKVELNVKTNRQGVAHVPGAPLGRALIQVIASGWKTYGRWYDITDPQQTIKIRLEKPPRWY
jgi:hypothetical protein